MQKSSIIDVLLGSKYASMNIVCKKLLIFLRFYIKKYKIYCVVQKISLEGLQLYQKKDPTQVLSCEYSKSFRDSVFIEHLLWLLLKELKKMKVSAEIAF